jgi:small subunit ribosomal protein S6
MKHYEVTFIVDPVLSGDEIKATETVYIEMLKNEGCTIVNIDEMGLKQMAYSINKKSSGIYFVVEFTSETGTVIKGLELALRRDERIMRFLTIALDKYGIKYNADKRAGLIGKVKKKVKVKKEDEVNDRRNNNNRNDNRNSAPSPKAEVQDVVADEPNVEAGVAAGDE